MLKKTPCSYSLTVLCCSTGTGVVRCCAVLCCNSVSCMVLCCVLGLVTWPQSTRGGGHGVSVVLVKGLWHPASYVTTHSLSFDMKSSEV